MVLTGSGCSGSSCSRAAPAKFLTVAPRISEPWISAASGHSSPGARLRQDLADLPARRKPKWLRAQWSGSTRTRGLASSHPDGGTPDVFVHHSAIKADGYRSLQDNQRVEFTASRGAKGPQADEVRPSDLPVKQVTCLHPDQAGHPQTRTSARRVGVLAGELPGDLTQGARERDLASFAAGPDGRGAVLSPAARPVSVGFRLPGGLPCLCLRSRDIPVHRHCPVRR
jgi:CspA family cold shock protein